MISRAGALALLLAGLLAAPAVAAPKKRRSRRARPAATKSAPREEKAPAPPPATAPSPAPAPAKGVVVDSGSDGKEKTFDFAAMGIEGRVLAPQLLYLLGRIKVELERGDLEARSFVPELVRSVDEGGL